MEDYQLKDANTVYDNEVEVISKAETPDNITSHSSPARSNTHTSNSTEVVVSPEDKYTIMEENKSDGGTIDLTNEHNPQALTRLISKTVHLQNKDGTTSKITKSVSKVTETTVNLPIAQSSLTQHGFECTNKRKTECEISPTFVGRIARKQNTSSKSMKVHKLVDTLDTNCDHITNDPLQTYISDRTLQSDVVFLELKDIEEEDPEPVYHHFGEDQEKNLVVSPTGVDHFGEPVMLNGKCDDCYVDYCDEFTYGPYCCAAVKRYWNENQTTATERNAYAVWLCHYNRALDWKSYTDSGFSERIRDTEISKAPFCMKKGSLFHSMQWIKWQIENGPMKDLYDEKRRRKKLAKRIKAANKVAGLKYRYMKGGNDGY